jgi:hypothetical protein
MTDTKTEHPTERWIWAGKRTAQGGKLVAAWIDPDGKELWFPARNAGASIGATYTAEVLRKAGGGVSLFGTPVFAERRDPDETRAAEWSARDSAAKAKASRATAERSDAKRDALSDAMAPLLEIAAKMRTGADKDAFIATVIRRLTATW